MEFKSDKGTFYVDLNKEIDADELVNGMVVFVKQVNEENQDQNLVIKVEGFTDAKTFQEQMQPKFRSMLDLLDQYGLEWLYQLSVMQAQNAGRFMLVGKDLSKYDGFVNFNIDDDHFYYLSPKMPVKFYPAHKI